VPGKTRYPPQWEWQNDAKIAMSVNLALEGFRFRSQYTQEGRRVASITSRCRMASMGPRLASGGRAVSDQHKVFSPSSAPKPVVPVTLPPDGQFKLGRLLDRDKLSQTGTADSAINLC
jgi:hypothetical protein